MIIRLRGSKALPQLHIKHGEPAYSAFPYASLTEMLFLYTGCNYPVKVTGQWVDPVP